MLIIRKEGSDNYLYLFSELQVIRIYIRDIIITNLAQFIFFVVVRFSGIELIYIFILFLYFWIRFIINLKHIPQLRIRNNFYYYYSCYSSSPRIHILFIPDWIWICCCCLPCNHFSNWTWVVEEIFALVLGCVLGTAGSSITLIFSSRVSDSGISVGSTSGSGL